MLILNLILLICNIVFIIFTNKYEKKQFKTIDKKKHKLKFLYPSAMYIINLLKKTKKEKINNKNFELIKQLYVNEEITKIYNLFYCEKIALGQFALIIFSILGILITINKPIDNIVDNSYIYRPVQGDSSKKYNLKANVEESSWEFALTLDERRYNNEEINILFNDARNYIDAAILGENISLDSVRSNLNLITNIPKSSVIIEWDVSSQDLIDKSGEIDFSGNIPEQGILAKITAKIIYYDHNAEYDIWLRIYPYILSKEEQMFRSLYKQISEINSLELTSNVITLPQEIEDKKIIWEEVKENNSNVLVIIGIVIIYLFYNLKDNDLQNKIKKRNEELLIDYPELISRFTLLLGAGMNIKSAWIKIITDYTNKVKRSPDAKRYVYEEMLSTWYELNLGVSEYKVYDDFGRRIKLQPYLKFSTLIVQNLQKGSKGLLELLEMEAIEAFEDRKMLAKRLGEEAGTKLLVPMMLMLLIVLVIIIFPAFISLKM